MKTIELINNNGYTMVSDEDYEYLNQWKWTRIRNNNRYYVGRKYKENGKLKTILIHRVIMNITDSNVLVDHIDTNEFNNQRDNLRLCNHSQNGANRLKKSTSTNTYKGIREINNKKSTVYRVTIKGLCDKTFKTVEEALEFQKKMYIQKYGEFARYYENRIKEKI